LKGIVFNLLEQAVEREFGAPAWDSLLKAAEVDGAYTSLGNYSDEELLKLVAAASVALQKPTEDVLRWFGIAAIPLLVAKYPVFFDRHQDTRSFLLTLNDIIHPEVRKLYPGADVPDFTYELSPGADRELVMIYASKRKLCMLAEGFIHGSAAHYSETSILNQQECMHRGDSHCAFHITFDKKTH
jgi:Haem-NO-binding